MIGDLWMFEIEFYEKTDGQSELWDFLEGLRLKSPTSKNARIQHKQISLYIQLLKDNGTNLPENVTKHLGGNLWELRPGFNRIFYFYYNKNTFVLLHHFRKKSQKTPRRELDKAKAEINDYLTRKETEKK